VLSIWHGLVAAQRRVYEPPVLIAAPDRCAVAGCAVAGQGEKECCGARKGFDE
jgi:hypothetical protein